METVDRVEAAALPTERPVQWWTGIKASLAVAGVFWLVTRGIPWAPSGLVSPTVMGREIKYPGSIEVDFAITAIMLHFISAVMYAAIMMPLIHRFRYGSAALIGATMGLILYGLNLAAFTIAGGGAPYSRELPVLITHLAFGLVFTGTYKGLVKRRITADF
jgi:hypothetical protein